MASHSSYRHSVLDPALEGIRRYRSPSSSRAIATSVPYAPSRLPITATPSSKEFHSLANAPKDPTPFCQVVGIAFVLDALWTSLITDYYASYIPSSNAPAQGQEAIHVQFSHDPTG
ncbi:hypothetical protein BGZ88_008596 [Linnemannia elongata]|nr:hypothetical protein BGZ88_008596 [Linnemannia elongata]